jgi:hypothetical protein
LCWFRSLARSDPFLLHFPPPPCAPQLQNQVSTANNAAASSAAGGAILPKNPAWAPWPVHAWPGSQTRTTVALSSAAAQIQKSNAQQIEGIQSQMTQQGC